MAGIGSIGGLPIGGALARALAPFLSDTHDAASYKKYRKKLEKAASAADEYNRSKYIKEAVKVADIAEELPISAPVIESISLAVEENRKIPEFDFSALQAEIREIKNYLDEMIASEEEDELIIMMAF